MKLFNFIRTLIEPFRHRATCPQDHKKVVHDFTRNLERKMCAPIQVPHHSPTAKVTRQQALRSKHA